MKQFNRKNKWTYSFIIGIIASCGVVSCDSNEVPSEYIPEKYLVIDEHEMNIGMASTFEVKVKASSTWKVSSTANWCHFEQPFYYGESSVLCKVDANRGEAARSCYLKIETFYKDNPITDSILVVQEVNTLPILEITPNNDILISADGEKIDLDVTYNYGIEMKVNYQKGENWISLTPEILLEVEKDPVTERIVVSVSANDVVEQRTAELIFINTQDQNVSDTIKIVQKPIIELTPAVTGFADNFNTVTTQGALYAGEGWTFEANPSDRKITFKQFTNGMKALLIHGSGISATAYGIMPAFNVKDMLNKKLSYRWAPGNNIVAGTEKFEVVASTDFRDDPFKATWTLVEDVTNTENPTAIRPLSLKEVDLAALAGETRVYIAFRYTGANSAYRFDDVKVGDVD